jgi:ATP adenylyltransferase/5',5'''-P-1,P-4-tetraphosphate phosphorylase II
MMLILRSQANYDDSISINGLGFAGLLLGRDESAIDTIK